MQLSDRTLVLFAVFAAMLAATALWLEFRPRTTVAETNGGPPPAPLIPVVTRSGGRDVGTAGPLRVGIRRGRVDAATLDCDGLFRAQRPTSSGRVVFPTIPLGQCHITLVGSDIPYEPVFPGDRLSCWIDDHTTLCSGGMAASYAARVSVAGDSPGTVSVDGVDLGALPVQNAPVRVGKRLVVVTFDEGATAVWTLTVAPDEEIAMHFPSEPAGMSGAASGLRGTPSMVGATDDPTAGSTP